MFKYGHMLREGDTLTWERVGAPPVQVKIKEIWDSKLLIPNPAVPNALQGSRWVDLWTYGPDSIERPVATVHTGDFSCWTVEPSYTFQIGTSTPYHGVR